MRLAIVRPDGESIRIRSWDGSNLPFYMYERTDVVLKKYDENEKWCRPVNSVRETIKPF